ncbi:MAG TPA: Asd/ArgC dimerization domain-containing protein, partial [Bryobacteraceae bacterium]|nr:Asd/ArgC dimerization domain-containing protein [Bryobacteraceae bacterium]
MAAIVGSGSLLGREIRDLLAELTVRTRLIGADPTEAVLTEDAGEPVVLTQLDEENLGDARVAFLAGSPESSRGALDIIGRLQHRPVVVDLTYTLDDRPGAFLRAPAVEPANYAVAGAAQHVIAHPAAIILGLFFSRLQQAAPVTRAVADIFEPASERGISGVTELQQQSVNLLSFQPPPKKTYDEQVAFNLLARWGEEAPGKLEDVESSIERHLATLLALTGVPVMPSLRLIQAPVFSGYSMSVWAEFEKNPGVGAIEAAIASAQVDVRGADLEPPNVVGMAGMSGISIGAITPDRNNPRACWFWIAADNIRVMAENAVA